MQHEPNEERGRRLLIALYTLAEADIPASPTRVADELGMPVTEVARLLLALDGQGLVDVERCRLTMSGLVLAVAGAGSTKVRRRAA